MPRKAFFLGKGNSRRFCLVTQPSGEIRGALLHVHPFAEELNRSRPMCALAAQSFASDGWLVLQIDSHGCGDSFGEFRDATWSSWQDDLDLACDWLRAQGHERATLWTLRGGSLLAASWLQRGGRDWPLLMWQPISSGKQLLTQTLRARLAADTGPEGKHVISRLRQQLNQGEPVDVGGYVVSAELAKGLEAATLEHLQEGRAPIGLIEVASRAGGPLTPASGTHLTHWRSEGRLCTSSVVAGPKFWQSYDTRMARDLVPSSLSMLESLT